MSASTLVDLGNTCYMQPSIAPTAGVAFPCSGAVVGAIVDMQQANTFTNVMVTGLETVGSGLLRIAVQTSNSTASGSFTDPTSGLAALPTAFKSGGIIWLNSGSVNNGGTFGAFVSGQALQSGFSVSAGFQRPATGTRYVRTIALSGDFYTGPLQTVLIGQLKVTGSGAGYSLSPTSGTPSV